MLKINKETKESIVQEGDIFYGQYCGTSQLIYAYRTCSDDAYLSFVSLTDRCHTWTHNDCAAEVIFDNIRVLPKGTELVII